MFDVRLDVCQFVLIGFRDHGFNSIGCRSLEFGLREHGANVDPERRIVHDREDVDGCVERRRERKAVGGSCFRTSAPISRNENALIRECQLLIGPHSSSEDRDIGQTHHFLRDAAEEIA